VPESTTFLHLTGLHLAPPGQRVVGIDPMRQMQDVLARIRQLDVSATFIVVSGDLTENGSAESYEVAKGALRELGGENTDTPVLLGLGNHDNWTMFRRVVLGEKTSDGLEPHCYSRLIDGLRVIMLDSLIPGHSSGSLGATQLAWLHG
jgi:Icc protein